MELRLDDNMMAIQLMQSYVLVMRAGASLTLRVWEGGGDRTETER